MHVTRNRVEKTARRRISRPVSAIAAGSLAVVVTGGIAYVHDLRLPGTLELVPDPVTRIR